MDLIVTYGIFHLTATEYMFFSTDNETFSKTGHILGQKASLNKYKKTKYILYFIIPQWNKLEIKYKKNNRKYSSR
jgi:hypothetical protein